MYMPVWTKHELVQSYVLGMLQSKRVYLNVYNE